MSENSVKLHRVISAPPEKVYRAFIEPQAMEFWLPPYGFLCEVQEMNPQVNGNYRASFTNFSTGKSHSFSGRFIEIKENDFLKYTDKFDDPNWPGELVTSVWFKKVTMGTEITITQENIPAAIPIDGCYLGWQDSLEKLAKLVQPDIQDE